VRGRIGVLSSAAAVALLLGACGSSNGAGMSAHDESMSMMEPAASAGSSASAASASSEASTHNAADVMFLQMMVAREVETARLTALAGRGKLSKQAAALVGAIDSTENDERAEMSGWLKAWGEPTTMATDADLHKEHGGVSALTKSDYAGLKAAPAAKFQTQYLNLMIAVQSNGAEIARYATENGQNAEVLDLADRIGQSRSAQVKQMLGLLAGPTG
jgi:uncharacterized protein (DUF305 family)